MRAERRTKRFTIGKLARAAGVNTETVRYYERRGLLPEPPRTESGYRQYDEESVLRVRFIKEAQALGFTLDEVRELLALRVDADTTCEQVRRQAEVKVAQIQAKIATLRHMQAILNEMIAACAQGGPTGECPILETLARRAEEGLS